VPWAFGHWLSAYAGANPEQTHGINNMPWLPLANSGGMEYK